MKIGFTGTQKGMTNRQKLALMSYLYNNDIDVDEAHHGGCIGADAEFQELMTVIYGPYAIHIHPPENKSKVDDPGNYFRVPGNQIYQPRPYLVRNKDIVNSVDIMFAAPGQKKEILRSGTWSTIRYTRKIGKELVVIYP